MKRTLIALLAVVMLLTLAACGGGSEVTVAPPTEPVTNGYEDPGPAPTDEPGEPGERGTLTMATNASFPPFEFVNEYGDFDGFDVHLANAIADILGKDLEILDMEFTAALASVTTGQADVAIAAITIREDRLEIMDFSTPYFQTTIVAIVPDDSDITTPDELSDKRIAVQFGTTSDIFCEDYLPEATVTRLNRAPDTVLELNNGRVDAIVIDRAVADQFINDNPGLRILDDPLGSENYGIAMMKGSDLLGPINDALETLKANGEYDRIYDMFFKGEE
jgi:polar amino acid transport system substrate-binding protein